MAAKEIKFNTDARDRMLKGVSILNDDPENVALFQDRRRRPNDHERERHSRDHRLGKGHVEKDREGCLNGMIF